MIDSYLKDSVFTAVKRDESSKQGMLKGYHSSMKVYERGTFFVKNIVSYKIKLQTQMILFFTSG